MVIGLIGKTSLAREWIGMGSRYVALLAAKHWPIPGASRRFFDQISKMLVAADIADAGRMRHVIIKIADARQDPAFLGLGLCRAQALPDCPVPDVFLIDYQDGCRRSLPGIQHRVAQ